MRKMDKASLLTAAALVVALLAVMVLAASCGTKTTTTSSSPTTVSTGDPVIDSAVDELDRMMNSVNPDDFSSGQLNDKELGL